MKKSNSQTQSAYSFIREQIINYSFAPGTIISDNQISKELNMSRAPVREAILMLQMDGLIQSNEDGKLCVSPIRMDDISDILHVRAALESEAIILIAKHGWLTSSQEQELMDLHQLMAESANFTSISSHYHYDDDFHIKIAEFSLSPRICDTLKRLRLQMERARWLNIALPPRQAEATKEHAMLLKYITDHNLQEACTMIRTHLENSENAFKHILQDRELQKLSIMINSFCSSEHENA